MVLIFVVLCHGSSNVVVSGEFRPFGCEEEAVRISSPLPRNTENITHKLNQNELLTPSAM